MAGADAVHALFPEHFLQRFLSQEIRPDARSFHSVRAMSMNRGMISGCDGSASVHLGSTSVVAGATLCPIAIPPGAKPEGKISVQVELGQICSSRFQSGRPGEEAVVMSQLLTRALQRSGAVDVESLVIKGEGGRNAAAWMISVDVTCLNYDGNVADAALLAAFSALADVKIPQVSISQLEQVVEKPDTEPSSLKILRIPVSLTHAVFESEGSMVAVVDPTAEEQDLSAALITVTVLLEADLFSQRGADKASEAAAILMYKQGGLAVDGAMLRGAIANARGRAVVVADMLAEGMRGAGDRMFE